MSPNPEPPVAQQPNIEVSGGTGHTINIISQGHYAKLKFSPTVQWYQQQMLKHGLWYWLMHGVVALLVVAAWEYRHVVFHLFR